MLFKSLLLAGTASASCLHGVYKRAEGGEVEIPQFGYEGEFGPLNWASLNENNTLCKTGKTQSPINIDSNIKLATEKPTLEIPEQKVEFENLNTTIEVVVEGTTKFAGEEYKLAQFHFHTPSEHRINREYFPLEAHFVHKGVANPDAIVVLALMFDLCTGESDPIISGLAPHLDAIKEPGTKTEIEKGLDFSKLQEHLNSSDIFQYTGSLTTPPCAEDVTFLAVKTPLKITVPDYNAIKGVVKFNSRLTQNTLGQQNIIEVAAESKASAAEEKAEAAQAASETFSGPPSGTTLTLSEISGQAIPTAIKAVVNKVRCFGGFCA